MPRLQSMMSLLFLNKAEKHEQVIVPPLNKSSTLKTESLDLKHIDPLKRSASTSFMSFIRPQRASLQRISQSNDHVFQTYRIANIDPKPAYLLLKPTLNQKLIQKIRGDGFCGWRAAWIAIIHNADPENLHARLKELGVNKGTAGRIAEASRQAKFSLGRILAHSSVPGFLDSQKDNLLCRSAQVRYAHEKQESEGYFDAEYDLYKVLKKLLPQLDIRLHPDRINDLLNREFADSEEVLSFARLLQQELVVNAWQQVHASAAPQSELGRALEAESADLMPIDQIKKNVTLLYDYAHFDIQLPEQMNVSAKSGKV